MTRAEDLIGARKSVDCVDTFMRRKNNCPGARFGTEWVVLSLINSDCLGVLFPPPLIEPPTGRCRFSPSIPLPDGHRNGY